MLSKDILGIYEAYSKMYQPTNPPEEVVEEEIDGLVEEVIGELFEECIEEGYTIDEAAVAIEEAATEYFDEAKITLVVIQRVQISVVLVLKQRLVRKDQRHVRQQLKVL